MIAYRKGKIKYSCGHNHNLSLFWHPSQAYRKNVSYLYPHKKAAFSAAFILLHFRNREKDPFVVIQLEKRLYDDIFFRFPYKHAP